LGKLFSLQAKALDQNQLLSQSRLGKIDLVKINKTETVFLTIYVENLHHG
jgi:hypothetical protein